MLPPPPLLALVAAHLDVASLLRLQRCSSTQRYLHCDDAWMSVAWRWAELHLLLNKNPEEWTLLREQCIERDEQLLIPVEVWRSTLPAWRAVAFRTELDDNNNEN